MPKPNEVLRDAYTAHQIGIERYSKRAIRSMLRHLVKIEADVTAKIQSAQSDWSRNQQEMFLIEVQNLYKLLYQDLTKDIENNLKEFSRSEIDFNSEALDRAAQLARINANVQVPTPETIYAATHARPFQGKLLREWLDGLEAGASSRVREAIRMGFTEGESIPNMVKRIRGARAANYQDGIMSISRRGAEAMVRTAVNHTAQVARANIFEANSDIIEGELWNSVLDMRTTAICRSRDGQVFELGKGARPPAHIGCRSYMSPILKGFPQPPRTSYEEWLKKQSPEMQDDILGKAKGKLFRDGKLPLSAFVDNGKELTLDQLKARHADVFDFSGLRSAGKKITNHSNIPFEEWRSQMELQGARLKAQTEIMQNGLRDKVEYLNAVNLETGQVFGLTKGVVGQVEPSQQMKREITRIGWERDSYSRHSSFDDLYSQGSKKEQDSYYLAGLKQVEFHHNHPEDGGLSIDDIKASELGVDKGIWAHGDRGSIYRAYNIKAGASKNYRLAIDEIKKFRATLEAGELYDAIKYNEGHIILQILSKSDSLNYEFALTEVRANQLNKPELSALIDRVAKKIK